MTGPQETLERYAHARSGDKGDRANIGVVCNDRDAYRLLGRLLTAESVATYLAPMGIGRVTRYELPNILAFNFVIDAALGGGASRSLRLDTQGKALGSLLMRMPIAAPLDPPSEPQP